MKNNEKGEGFHNKVVGIASTGAYKVKCEHTLIIIIKIQGRSVVEGRMEKKGSEMTRNEIQSDQINPPHEDKNATRPNSELIYILIV